MTSKDLRNLQRAYEKGNLGICRCCLSIGFFKSISKSYTWSGEHEVYENILKECFNIKLKPLPFTILQNTICDTCIIDLRSTYKFRKKVLQSEKAILKKTIKIMEDFKGEANDAVIIYVDEHVHSDSDECVKPNIKMETEMEFLDEDEKYFKEAITTYHSERGHCDKIGTVKQRDDKGDTMSEFNDAVILHVGKHARTDDELDIKSNIKLEIEANKEFGNNRKTYLNKKNQSGCCKKPSSVNNKAAKRSDHNKLTIRKEMALNINTVIKNSTVLPFRYSCSRSYLCFYCSRSFTDHGLLRTHTLHHKDYPDLMRIIRKQLQSKLVYVDVTDLSCKLCFTKLKNYPALKEHLTVIHKIQFKNTQEGLVPFKLRDGGSFECQICKKNFNGFQNLSIHLNEHYEYCTCEACGASFLSESRLIQHQKISGHLLDPQVGVKKKTYKCHCGQVFTSSYLRRKHEIYDHKMKAKMHECKQCDMKFLLGNTLRRHVRMTHLNEKNYKCPICGRGFYSKISLHGHSIVHTGEKKYKCDICFKRLGRKKSLINHFRMHNGESRFICDICGRGFIQKPNLEYHMRKKHAEENDKKMPRKTYAVMRRFKIVPQGTSDFYSDMTM